MSDYAPRGTKAAFVVHACPLDVGGYDEGQAYWGRRTEGVSLWRAVSEGGEAEFFFDAGSREHAVAHVLSLHPASTIVETPLTRHAEEFILGYIEAALWMAEDERNGQTKTDLREYAMNAESERAMREDCAAFINENVDALKTAFTQSGYSAYRAGADFWLSRSLCGAGFCARYSLPSEVVTALSAAATRAGEKSLYVGDDGEVYQAGNATYTGR